MNRLKGGKDDPPPLQKKFSSLNIVIFKLHVFVPVNFYDLSMKISWIDSKFSITTVFRSHVGVSLLIKNHQKVIQAITWYRL